jgi:hypothetical protein
VSEDAKTRTGATDGARVGAVLSPRPVQATVRRPSVDGRSAMAEALAAFLARASFTQWGKDAPDRPFALRGVLRQWPDSKVALDTPCASILDLGAAVFETFALVPAPLEETIGLFEPETVLWKTAELASTFQVDFWAPDEPTREAIAAALPSLFAPGEDQYGLLVQGPETYFGRPVRLTLVDAQRMDNEFSIYPRERRLMVRVRAEVDEVHLRCARLASARVALAEIGESADTSTIAVTEPDFVQE